MIIPSADISVTIFYQKIAAGLQLMDRETAETSAMVRHAEAPELFDSGDHQSFV